MTLECRICKQNKNNLINPCKCTDPVCIDCIKKWGENRQNCEVCTEPYSMAQSEPRMLDKLCWVIGKFIFACFNIMINIVVILVVLFIMIGTSYPIPHGFWTANDENALLVFYVIGSIPIFIWQLFLKNCCVNVYIKSFSIDPQISSDSLNICNLCDIVNICKIKCDTARNNFYPNSNKYKFKFLGTFLLIFVTTIETCTGILLIYIVEHRVMFNLIAWYYGVVINIIIMLGLSLLLGCTYCIVIIFFNIFKSLSDMYSSEHKTETIYVNNV